MAEYTASDLEVEPCFDLELLLNTSQESRIDGEMMDRLGKAWDRWLPHVHARKIETPAASGSVPSPGGSYLLAWLDEAVEDEVDDVWEQSPSDAFMFNALAQVMCMGIIHSLLPQVEEAGCAPAPHPTDALADALEAEGAPYAVMGEPGLARRFAVLTWFPFRGGCEICALRDGCPKAGGAGPYTVTLPGSAP